MIQKPAAVGTWWLAASSRQCTCSYITSPGEFFGETWNHPGNSSPLQPRLGALWLLPFSKTKITFEREESSNYWWDSGKYKGAADGDWENCVRSQGAYFEGDWGAIVLCTMFLVSSSVNASIFHSTWLDTFWTGLVYPEVELLGQKAVTFLIFWGNSILFSIVAAPVCIGTNGAWEFPFLHILANTCCLRIYWW